MSRMFRVYSVINNVTYNKKNYDNVIFNWFIIERGEKDFPFEKMIINHALLTDKDRKNAEKYISELFTAEEAETLRSELNRKSNSLTRIEEIKLPIPDNIKPYGSLKVEEGKGFSDLFSRKSYNLTFKVRGFFNIYDSDESLRGDDNPTEITRLPDNFLVKKK